MKQIVNESLSLLLFREMLRIRLIEEAIGKKYPEQQMRCPVHLSIGQEAVAVGVCQHLAKTDYLVSSHRAHAHYLAKGGSFKRMLAEIYGKVDGCSSGKGGSMHLTDDTVGMIGSTPIVGGTIPVGVGLAFAAHLRGEQKLSTIFFGEGATEEGVWAESLNFATLKKLPVLFVCENNLYSVCSPLSVRQSPDRSRVGIAREHGMQTFEGYGNDVEEVYKVAGQAVNYIRSGKGPCFVEFSTYRYRENCGPNTDDDLGYRPAEEIAYWAKRCPIATHETMLKASGQLSDSLLKGYHQEIDAEIQEAFEFAMKSPFPTFNPNVRVYA